MINIFLKLKNSINQIKSKPLSKKIIYTLLIILLFRLAASITTPGMKVDISKFDNGSIFGIMDLMGGGTLKNFSIVALGIGPYIMASIIMQLLQSEVFPPLYRLSKSGPDGKRKINIITRIVTICFAFVQAITISQQNSSLQNYITFDPSLREPWFEFFVLPVILVAGSLFTLFLGEQITKNGVGNGTSLIIFSGAVASMPPKIKLAFSYFILNSGEGNVFSGVFNFVFHILLLLFIFWVLTFFYNSERHIPIQQTGAAMTQDVKQMSRLPIKLNPAGVMPIIFAMMMTSIPQLSVQFVDKQNVARQFIEKELRLSSPLGLSILVTIVFFFSIVMALVTFNPLKIAEQFQKNSTFIPGIKIGDETEEYLTGVVTRIACFSGVFLSIVTATSYLQQMMGLPAQITFGGTTIIIMVSVVIETLGQLKARSTSHKIIGARIKAQTNVQKNDDKLGGLLW